MTITVFIVGGVIVYLAIGVLVANWVARHDRIVRGDWTLNTFILFMWPVIPAAALALLVLSPIVIPVALLGRAVARWQKGSTS